MTVLAIIPARYQSSRFPGKPLALLAGKPMIQHVYEKVLQASSIERVVVATDDERIFAAVQKFGGQVRMTRADHPTGTDRIVEVAEHEACDWVLNVQGDEPLIHPADLDRLVQAVRPHPRTKVATLIFPLTGKEEAFHNPNVVKVVLNRRQEAIYFSRASIPFPRLAQQHPWKHMGIYLYRRDFLLQFHAWEHTPLEQTEQLEQLRIIEHGEAILCIAAQYESVGVDTPADLQRAEALLRF